MTPSDCVASPPFAVRFLRSDRREIGKRHPIWNERLPEHPAARAAGGGAGGLRYGAYFESVRDVLLEGDGWVLAAAVGRQMGTAVQPADLQALDICLEKHGAHYHPARLQVRCRDTDVALMMSVAPSETGKQLLRQDFENLQRLGAADRWGFLPRVYYFFRSTETHTPAMMLGQWLDGFDEFHLSRKADDGGCALVVWAPEGPRQPTSEQSDAVYRGAASLLTAFYNPLTFEQIGQWHHAAGDFVVAVDANPPAVRLTTVRSYAPLLEGVPVTTQTVLHGLLLFLVNLTVRMRFDRLDGTGAAVLADSQTVFPVVEGFFEGLRLREIAGSGLEGLAAGFGLYLARLSESDLSTLVTAVGDRIAAGTPGRELVAGRSGEHAAALAAAAVAGPALTPLHGVVS
ncbi:MAG TPA: hypothetical protein ACFCUC_02240 [Desulfobacterales bacterium]